MEDKEALANAVNKALSRVEDRIRLQENRAMSALLATADGRDLLWRLLQISGLGGTPYTESASRTAFNCGEQNVGLQLQAWIIETEPEGYLRILQDQQAYEAERNHIRTETEAEFRGVAD